MSDQEFFDFFISERTQLLYSREQPSLTGDELNAALQLEVEYNLALEQLPPEAATAVKKFHKKVVVVRKS